MKPDETSLTIPVKKREAAERPEIPAVQSQAAWDGETTHQNTVPPRCKALNRGSLNRRAPSRGALNSSALNIRAPRSEALRRPDQRSP
jgi:hypothetical protein